VELIPGFNDTIPIVTVHDENEALCVLEVMPPQRPDLFPDNGGENKIQFKRKMACKFRNKIEKCAMQKSV
jgi:hypothetical protein